ncbi:cysteine-rich CWC family protein [Massilia sp. Bi118]|uniref:cysteine-rich CWC family protein n=1 Tax=Massilia sp. Bi118 TaxID=2822346 RepID=UPI001E5D3D3E|nr:cysteine-rich CWC family protein [Massilia sp. Bi118]
MSTCTRCGASFGCAMVDGSDAPCWCTSLPPIVPVPASASTASGADASASGCWCPACLREHIAHQTEASSGTAR